MASRRVPLRDQRKPRASRQKDQGKRPQGIKKESPPQNRRSKRSPQARRSECISRLQESSQDRKLERRPSSAKDNHLPPLPSKGQKRPREAERPVDCLPTSRPRKRIRSSHARPFLGQRFDHDIVSGITTSQRSHISEWATKKEWPKEFFEQDKMHHLLTKKKPSTASLRRKRSEASLTTSTTPSDLQAEKSASYKNPSYETVLERDAGSYMGKYKPGVTEASERLCQTLLDSKQITPKDTIFRDDIFDDTCERLRGKNEARIFKDCTPLIVPWAEAHASLSANRDLNIAIESVNEGWNNSNPITKPRPQPNYAIGFKRIIFSND